MPKTNLDLYKSAHEAALKSLPVTTAYAIETESLGAFNAEPNDPADWPFWKATFDERRAKYALLSKQAAPSAAVAPAASRVSPAPVQVAASES